ncbi:hypothetical protein BDD12DRAFT_904282 [Trichophaea hybrida]|nr:hypothetical protein BDD12DRAFT_904282 [Trichophaea hybrida]
MYVYPAGSIQINSIGTAAYVQRSAPEYIQGSAAEYAQHSTTEYVQRSAIVIQILELLQHHLVLSILNETQDQLHLSQAIIKNAVEQIQNEMLAVVLTDSISAEDTANVSSDLTELDTEDEKIFKEEEEERKGRMEATKG